MYSMRLFGKRVGQPPNQPHPSNHICTPQCTHATATIKPSDNFLWCEMQSVTAAHLPSWCFLNHMTLEPTYPRGLAFYHKWEQQMLKKETPRDQITYKVACIQKYASITTHRQTGRYICCSDPHQHDTQRQTQTHANVNIKQRRTKAKQPSTATRRLWHNIWPFREHTSIQTQMQVATAFSYY